MSVNMSQCLQPQQARIACEEHATPPVLLGAVERAMLLGGVSRITARCSGDGVGARLGRLGRRCACMLFYWPSLEKCPARRLIERTPPAALFLDWHSGYLTSKLFSS